MYCWKVIRIIRRGAVTDGGVSGYRLFRVYFIFWVGLYSVMLEDFVRKLVKTVFLFCENRDVKDFCRRV